MIEQRFEGMARAHHVAQKLTTRTFPFVSFRGNAVPSGAFLSVKFGGFAMRPAFFFGLGAMEERETRRK